MTPEVNISEGKTQVGRHRQEVRQASTVRVASAIVVAEDAEEISGCPPGISVVEPTDLGDLDNPSAVRRLDGSRLRRVFRQRQVNAAAVIVGEVLLEGSPEVPFAEDDHVVEAFPADAPDQAFAVWVLPGRSRGDPDLLDSHGVYDPLELLAVDAVAVAEKESWGGVPRERFADLLPRPVCGRMRGHVEVKDAPAIVSQDDEDEEDAEGGGRHDEEVDGDDLLDVVLKEGPPGR
jgi:hypothetical protein